VRLAYDPLSGTLGRAPTGPELDMAYAGELSRNPSPRLSARRLGLTLADGRRSPRSAIGIGRGASPPPTEVRWHVPAVLSPDLAYFIGLVVGDGHFEQGAGTPAFNITASEPEIQAQVLRIARTELGIMAKVHRFPKRAPRISFSQNV